MIRIGEPSFIPLPRKHPSGGRDGADGNIWIVCGNWALVSDQQKRTPVPVVKLGNQNMLELDLAKVNLPPGDYKLTGFWDWTAMEADRDWCMFSPLSDFKKAHLDPASQDRLLAASGNMPVKVTGSDFEFTTKVELQKLNDEFATPEPVRFLLPKGLRKGPQDHMDVQIATQSRCPAHTNC